jgi:hypothetical protein
MPQPRKPSPCALFTHPKHVESLFRRQREIHGEHIRHVHPDPVQRLGQRPELHGVDDTLQIRANGLNGPRGDQCSPNLLRIVDNHKSVLLVWNVRPRKIFNQKSVAEEVPRCVLPGCEEQRNGTRRPNRIQNPNGRCQFRTESPHTLSGDVGRDH